MVLGKLEKDGPAKRAVGARGKRRHHLQLTAAGEIMLARLAGPARRAPGHTLAQPSQS
jgi:DNA-binding MarR family transcriptional regulator